jgi:hypothetical protein
MLPPFIVQTNTIRFPDSFSSLPSSVCNLIFPLNFVAHLYLKHFNGFQFPLKQSSNSLKRRQGTKWSASWLPHFLSLSLYNPAWKVCLSLTLIFLALNFFYITVLPTSILFFWSWHLPSSHSGVTFLKKNFFL